MEGFIMTEARMEILAEMTIEALLRRWPETAVVFHKHNMACAGCAVAPFYTAADAAQVYGLPPEELLTEIEAAIKSEEIRD
jgi:hybrid cluster-associated redox disulfide protein